MIRHLTGTVVVESVEKNTKAANIMANEQDNESLADPVTPATSITTNGARTSSAAGEALWATLLSELTEVCTRIRHLPGNSPTSGFTLLFGASVSVSQTEIIRHMPSRHTCDKLVARYLSLTDPVLAIMHQPTLLKQYEAFWHRQSQTSIIWLAVLFGVVRIAVHSWLRDGGEPIELQGKCQDLATSYRCRAAECLAYADFSHPQEYLIEALLLNLHADHSSSQDFNPSLWVFHGMVVRTSMRAGYHLEPDTLGDLTPFQGEMRRRAWAYIRSTDTLYSFQVGLPLMLDARHFRLSLPRNLSDDQFDQLSTELPPSLPDTKMTTISLLLVKVKLTSGLATALREVGQAEEVPYERVLSLDSELRQMFKEVPDHFRIDQLPEQPVNNALQLVAPLALTGMYHKTLCVAHSRYLRVGGTDQKYLYSRLVCLDSAMTLLAFQAFQHQQCYVDGRMTNLTKYQTSLTLHDYFLAATILCTALFLGQGTRKITVVASAGPSREEIFAALDKSVSSFEEMSERSNEAFRACGLLRSLVQELRRPSKSSNSSIRADDAFRDASAQPASQQRPASMDSSLHQVGNPAQMDAGKETLDVFQHDAFAVDFAEEDFSLFGLDLDDPLSYVNSLQLQGDISF